MSALAVVQARMSSTRLPGKVLADVGGEPMLALLARRLRRASQVEDVVLATSVESPDDDVAEAATTLGLRVHRGPLDDVLRRFVEAAGDHPGPIVRITADCPLVDPATVDRVVALFCDTPAAGYGSNVEPGPRTFPKGLDVEVFAREALLAADREATEAVEREHVTPWIRAHERAVVLEDARRLGELRWTVDTPEDLAFVRAVVARLGDRRTDAGIDEILAAVRREPSLAEDGLRG